MKNSFVLISLFLSLASVLPLQAEEWQVPGHFSTIQEAVDSPSVQPGDRILVGAGAHAGAVLGKTLEIRGQDGATIVSGPVHASGMLQGFRLIDGSDGTTITHLHFAVDLPIMNAAGRTFPLDPGQAMSRSVTAPSRTPCKLFQTGGAAAGPSLITISSICARAVAAALAFSWQISWAERSTIT